tara:strand:- start:2379 stop:2870 length:492 start_codon:yes stop_codon:yes gene_type:complete
MRILKYLSIFTLISLISISCESTQEEDSLSENLKTYEDVWATFFNERDMDVLNSQSFTDDVKVVLPGDDSIGIEGLKNHYGNYLSGFSDAEFTFVDLFGQGDKLVKHWNFKGTHDGDFFGIPATGNKVDLSGTTLILMEDGKIKQEQDFFDNLDFYTQLGLME